MRKRRRRSRKSRYLKNKDKVHLKSKKNKKKSRKRNKRKSSYKLERRLEGDANYEITYATKAKCTYKTEDFDTASNNTIQGTLKGRYFLEIEFKFNNKKDMEDFQAINLDVHYGHGYTKKYEFMAHNENRRSMFSRTHKKITARLFRGFSILQERKLKIDSDIEEKNQEKQNLEEQQRKEQRAKDLPKLIV
jgi:hypothetical protein